MYIHEHANWPNMAWDQNKLCQLNAEVRFLQGRLHGRMDTLGHQLREEATLATLTQDVLQTSAIEGVKLDIAEVHPAIAQHLGININPPKTISLNAKGIIEIAMDVTRNYTYPLTQERLFGWHATLFPEHGITIGAWRNETIGPMQVISGGIGREVIHYEAPSAERLHAEMARFLKWLNAPSKTDLIIKSALAHFWFVTIHPFEDGNGRIARAIGDMVLARSEKSKQRFYSMSAQIQRERNVYYDMLESCQKGSLDITAWIEWYFNCLKRAIAASEEILQAVLAKARFWEANRDVEFNKRQRKVINRLLDGVEGKLTTSKWAKLAKCSQDTALRDIDNLLARKILTKNEAGGRSTSYQLQAHDFD
ncbi:MAG: Fic family protein [Pseudomonadota bacterium]